MFRGSPQAQDEPLLVSMAVKEIVFYPGRSVREKMTEDYSFVSVSEVVVWCYKGVVHRQVSF